MSHAGGDAGCRTIASDPGQSKSSTLLFNIYSRLRNILLQSLLHRISSPFPRRQPEIQVAGGVVSNQKIKKSIYMLKQVPNIVVRPPKEKMEDSATFQRLGMRPQPSRLSEVCKSESFGLFFYLKGALAVVESEVLSPKPSPPASRHAILTYAQVQ